MARMSPTIFTRTPQGAGRLHGPDGEKCPDITARETLANTASFRRSRHANRAGGRPAAGPVVSPDPAGSESPAATPKNPKKPKKRLIACFLRVEELSADARRRLYQAACEVRDATNAAYLVWYGAMQEEHRADDLRIFLRMLEAWTARDPATRGEKPTLEFTACDPEIARRMNATIRERFPGLHSRVATYACQAVLKKIGHFPSRSGRLRLWQSILLGRETIPMSVNLLPIPFDNKNAELEETEGELWLGVRVEAREVASRVNRVSQLETMRLVVPSRTKKRLVGLAVEAARGQRPWAASKLVYDARRRRWSVALVVEDDPPPPASPYAATETAVLTAPVDACWRLAAGERVLLEIGGGDHVRHLRQRLSRARATASADPMRGPARNGHGRKRARKAAAKLTGYWTSATRTLNYQAIARILRTVRQAGLASLEYRVPDETCLLNTAGRDSGAAWPLYQFREILERKCIEQGIALRISEAKTAPTDGDETVCAASGVETGETAG